MPAHSTGGNKEFLSVIGTTSSFFYIYNMKVAEGRVFNDKDNNQTKNFMVLGSESYKKFFGDDPLKNQKIFLFNVPFKVIGKLEERGTDISGNSLDNKAFIPLKTALKRMLNQNHIDGIYILVDKEKNLDFVRKEVEKYLFFKHGKKDFTVMPYSKLSATQNRTIKIFSKLAITVSIISFFVGALGIFALMIISVYERFIEIGVRRAFGARKIDIILQFLMESFLGCKDNTRLLDDEFYALKNISLLIKENEKLAILGPNGSGKSTLLKMLNGIYMPNEGQITVEGNISSVLEL
ncbi:MAG TPA: ATP-binding cassette domain-containing protein, partial [Aquificae bacterium]|nr:ATP-binding cassette domain-containing protein [Aquificota bacterium]